MFSLLLKLTSKVSRNLGAIQFGGMEVSDAKRLRELESENAKLKKLLAETMLDNAALKDVVSRKW